MYTLIFESNFTERIVARHVSDIEHCEEQMVYYCLDHGKNIICKRTWMDGQNRLVYDLGLESEFFICANEK